MPLLRDMVYFTQLQSLLSITYYSTDKSLFIMLESIDSSLLTTIIMMPFWNRQIKYFYLFALLMLCYNPIAFASLLSDIEGIQIYKKNTSLTPERKQHLADDIDRYHRADNMWDILQENFTLSHEERNPAVREQIRFFMNNPDFLVRATTRAAPYLYYITQQVKKRHLPAELVLLPIMESAYNPFAYSAAGAGGIWQMMPGTASDFGIKQNWWYDGRRDVIASTKAALDYLVYLGGFFDNNWLLAFAAYDTGEGRVLAAIRKNVREGRDTDFWSLSLPQETRDYVPRLLALATIISHPEEYPINFPTVQNAPFLAEVDVGGQIDLNHAAVLAGLSAAFLKQLNPGYTHRATDPTGPYKLILPIEHVEQFTDNFIRSPFYEQIHAKRYVVKSGDTLALIAQRFKTNTPAIRQFNTIKIGRLKPGTNLLIPQSQPELSKAILTAAKKTPIRRSAYPEMRSSYTIKPGDTLYMIRHGDSVAKIAAHFRIPVQALLAANPLRSTQSIAMGDKLIIPTHLNKTA